MSGKGDTTRPSSVSSREYAERWERTFGKLFDGAQPERIVIAPAFGIAGEPRVRIEQMTERITLTSEQAAELRQMGRKVAGTLVYPTTPGLRDAKA